MESPEDANEIACPMVLHAVLEDAQFPLSLPLTPFTYHVLANVGTVTLERPSSRIMHVIFIFLSL
jgi:hypothetical protein